MPVFVTLVLPRCCRCLSLLILQLLVWCCCSRCICAACVFVIEKYGTVIRSCPPPHPHPDTLTWAPDPLPSTLLSPQISLRESWRYGHSKTLRAGSRYVDSPVCTRALW
jgi:hypothetical protein